MNRIVKLAFQERDASMEAQTQRLEDRRLRDRVADLSNKLSAVAANQHDMKSDNTLEKKISSLEHKLARSNALIVDLQKSNKDMEERFTAQITQLERKLDHGLNSERTKKAESFQSIDKEIRRGCRGLAHVARREPNTYR